MISSKWIRKAGRSTRCALVATCLTFGATNICAQSHESNETMPPLSAVQLTQLNAVLTDKLRRYANSQRWFEGQVHDIRLSAKYDVQTQVVTVDLGEEFGPDSLSAGMEDLEEELENDAYQVLMDVAPYRGISLLFGGKDMYYWYPEQRRD